ncbi:helix-turn-helix domain-containing protein [Alkanindiges illinoisensis]|uniref:XRE family transcriptional regulator n=1 Tax=Alkanindiges illinoisensis TaxID=197183 RepID=A0A4Y7XAN9_9GAMM|nr:helix-turn-helix transcriptional regulator [Alkanindiges illinoisensis]TEU25169.1 XRE family transcriptional regulator [Alkanindiges illinoisensis]
MNNFKLSIHSPQHKWLREYFVQRRKELGLSQRAFAVRLNVVYSFVGKIETGDRRLDMFEFINYCEALEVDPIKVIEEIRNNFYKN